MPYDNYKRLQETSFVVSEIVYAETKGFIIIFLLLSLVMSKMGAHGRAVGLDTALQAGRSRVRFTMGSLGIFLDIIHPASNRNVYQEYFPGLEVGLTTSPPLCTYFLGILFPQPAGTHSACPDMLQELQKICPKCLTLRRLMSYIYGAPILDVSRSHTTTHHSR